MANKILTQNKIPGCDRLTRPEEIAALSRYLRNIREIQEEHTNLDETTLEMPGVTTGQFVDIKELPTGYDKLKVSEKVVGLPEDYVKLDKGNDKIVLEDHVEGLEDNRKISLSNYIENLEDNRKPELSTFRDDLEDNRTPELSNYKEGLEDNRDIDLSNHREDLEDNREIGLSDYKEKLTDDKEPKLSNYKEDLEDSRDIDLSNYKEKLTDDKEPELSNYKEGLVGDKNKVESLYDSALGLYDDKEPELSNYRESLYDDKEPKLNNYREGLYNDKESELSDYVDPIKNQEELDKVESLYNSALSIVDDRENELEDYKDNLVDDRENELEDYRDNLVDDRTSELEDYIDPMNGEFKEVTSLYDTIIGLNTNYYNEETGTPLTDGEARIDGKYDYGNLKAHTNTVIDLPNTNSYNGETGTPITDGEARIDGKYNYLDQNSSSAGETLSDHQIDPISLPSVNYYNEETGTPITDGEARVIGVYDYGNEEAHKHTVIALPDSSEGDARDTGTYNYLDQNSHSTGSLSDYQIDPIQRPEVNYYNEETGTSITDGEARVTGVYDYGNEEEHKHTVIGLPDSSEGDARDTGTYNYLDQNAQTPDDELSNYQIDPIQRPDFNSPEARVDNEYDYFNNDIPYDEEDGINPLEMKARAKFALHRELVDLPETSESDARIDEDYNYFDKNSHNFNAEGPQPIDEHKDLINLPESSEGDARVDDDYKYINQYSQMTDDDLYNYLIDAIRRPDFVGPEARTDNEYDYFDNTIEYNEEDGTNPLEMKAKTKFKRHQTRLKPSASPNNGGYDPDDISSWDQKLEALVSAYLSSDKIKPNNAHRFQDELTRMITVLNHVTNEYEQIELENQTTGGANGDGTARTDDKYDFLDNNSINLPSDEKVFNRHSKTQVKLGKPNQKLEDYNNSEINTRTELVDDNPIRDANRGPYNFIDLRDKDEKKYGYDKNELLEEQKVPKYILPEDTTRSLLTYIRSKAEEKVEGVSGSERRYEIEEALWTLIVLRRLQENLSGSYRSKLPGIITDLGTRVSQTIRQEGPGIEGLIDDGIGLAIGRFINYKPLPINKPLGVTETFTGATIKKPTTGFHRANSRTEKKINEGNNGGAFNSFLDKLHLDKVNQWIENVSGSIQLYGNYPFATNYLMGTGIATTLSDLCDGKQASQIGSVEDLIDTLKRSEYITTPSKFGTVERGSYGTQTLDNNSYWEVVIEPLCSADLNGGWSFLPAIQEINLLNYIEHGVKTGYNKWIPISSFELQKSKLTTKSVGLYDGEIVMPISAEFTNELRLTVVDDQYKSWRRYFQTCMDVSVYNSKAHKCSYYTSDIKTKPKPTFIDKSNICIAFYKNITFSIKIYILTPQFSTIKKYSLLCVLKDFAEEYSGDVDGGGVDLSVSFSIVGEMSQEFQNYNNEQTRKQNTELIPELPPKKLNPTANSVTTSPSYFGIIPDDLV